VEDVLQSVIVEPHFEKLWECLSLQSDVIGLEHTFQRKCAQLALKPLDFFGLSPEMLNVKYDLVLDQLGAIPTERSPSKMLNALMSTAKCILLTIRAASQLHSKRKKRSNTTMTPVKSLEANSTDSPICIRTSPYFPSSEPDASAEMSADSVAPPNLATLSADDVLPLYIYLLAHAEVRDLVLVREMIVRLGDTAECSERSYYFTMFSSAVEYIFNADLEEYVGPPTNAGEDSSNNKTRSCNQYREKRAQSVCPFYKPRKISGLEDVQDNPIAR
jgi:hypothetical protein